MRIASFKMLRSVQNFTSLNIFTTQWSICQRGISNKNLLEKLGLPEKPKRPPTPFIMYTRMIKPQIIKKNPNISLTETTKMAANLWKNVDPDEKAKLGEQFKIEYEKYKKELEKYENSLTREQKNEIKEAEEEIKNYKEQRLMKLVKQKREKELNKPKGPLLPFYRFCASVDKGSNTTAMHWKNMAEKWSKLPENEKQKYTEIYQKERQQYLKDLNLWEEQMIKQGHLDLVRSKTLKYKIKNNST